MTTKHLLAALLLSSALVACVPPAPQPTPSPQPAPSPAPPPAPAQPPPPTAPAPPSSGNWLDAPQTPGDWSYSGGIANFGERANEPVLVLRCDRGAGVIDIERRGTATAQTITIRTETAERAVAATSSAGSSPAIVARVPARDSLLDAMAFSRGRYAVETPGLPTIYVPAWPEVTRVIEDCR